MTKWNLQSEKPIQEHFTRPCWVQRQNGGIYCFFPSEKYLDCLKINTGNGAPAEVYLCDSFFPCDEIVAWQYFEFPAAPEPYVPAPGPPKMKAEWIDGAVRVPTGKAKDSGFLIREKGAWYHKAVEWAPWAQEFVWLDPRTQRYIIYKPETVEWLEITEEQS